MNRREMMKQVGVAALGLSAFPWSWVSAAEPPKRRLFMFTRSQGFQHSVVKRDGDNLSLAERIVTELGKKLNVEVKCSKDGRDFVNEDLAKFDGFFFMTTGDLTVEKSADNTPPMPPESKKKFLDAIAGGKGFIGCHCATDTFHSKGPRDQNQEPDQRDPYIAMIGGEFIVHGSQQKAWMRVVSNTFPGLEELKDFEMHEEWYALKNFAPDLHVILAQDCSTMKTDKGNDYSYKREPYPATWARKHDKGRVFYTSMGHREDVWESQTMATVLTAALHWTLGNVDADVTPNIDKVTPKASELAKKP